MANIILFVSVNVAGIFINNVTQRAQRKTFVDTRNCIAARKEIQQENEKLVNFSYVSFIIFIFWMIWTLDVDVNLLCFYKE